MASLTITIVVAADPNENVHTHIAASGAAVWEIRPMLERAIADLRSELGSLPPSHSPAVPAACG